MRLFRDETKDFEKLELGVKACGCIGFDTYTYTVRIRLSINIIDDRSKVSNKSIFLEGK